MRCLFHSNVLHSLLCSNSSSSSSSSPANAASSMSATKVSSRGQGSSPNQQNRCDQEKQINTIGRIRNTSSASCQLGGLTGLFCMTGFRPYYNNPHLADLLQLKCMLTTEKLKKPLSKSSAERP